MESEAYAYGLSDAAASRSSQFKSHSHFYFDYEEVDGDDDLNPEYPCPFCSEDFDLVELCCHIDDEHPIEAESGICPVCSTRVGANMVGHITMQHGDILHSQNRLKFDKDDSPQALSFGRKEFEDDHVISLISGSSSVLSTSNMAINPLLSFLRNPVLDASKTIQAAPLSKVNLVEKDLGDKLSERDVRLDPIPEKNEEEKSQRCEFVQGLVLSTIFGDDL